MWGILDLYSLYNVYRCTYKTKESTELEVPFLNGSGIFYVEMLWFKCLNDVLLCMPWKKDKKLRLWEIKSLYFAYFMLAIWELNLFMMFLLNAEISCFSMFHEVHNKITVYFYPLVASKIFYSLIRFLILGKKELSFEHFYLEEYGQGVERTDVL